MSEISYKKDINNMFETLPVKTFNIKKFEPNSKQPFDLGFWVPIKSTGNTSTS